MHLPAPGRPQKNLVALIEGQEFPDRGFARGHQLPGVVLHDVDVGLPAQAADGHVKADVSTRLKGLVDKQRLVWYVPVGLVLKPKLWSF